jgi:hypothetical protein
VLLAEEDGALLDVELDVRVGHDAARDTRAAPAQPRSSSRKTTTARPGLAERLDRLESGKDAERPVEAAPAPGTVSRCEPVQT